jgi:hypothetical protein
MSARPDIVDMRERSEEGRSQGVVERWSAGRKGWPDECCFVKPLGSVRCGASDREHGGECGQSVGERSDEVDTGYSLARVIPKRYGHGGSIPYALAPNMVDGCKQRGTTILPLPSTGTLGHVGGMHPSHLDPSRFDTRWTRRTTSTHMKSVATDAECDDNAAE